jgi:hypothetical protein
VVDKPARSFAGIEDAAARLMEHDALLDVDLARELAERGTTVGEDGRRRWKHDPLHATIGPYGGFRFDVAARFWSASTAPVLLVEGSASEFRHPPAELDRRAACFKDVRRATLGRRRPHDAAPPARQASPPPHRVPRVTSPEPKTPS